MSIAIAKLTVLQNGLRNFPQIDRMKEFVAEGGSFTFDARLAQHILTDKVRGTPPPMHISIMEDGRFMLHDGHHRAVAMLLGGREYIDDDEHEVGHYTYDDYLNLHPERGWFTPFDVDTEVRKPEFSHFKNAARHIYGADGLELLREFILTNRDMYVEPRRIHTVEELVQVYLKGESCQKTYANCAAAS